MSDKNIDWIKRLQLLEKALKENRVNSSVCVELETKISGYELDFTEHDKVFEDKIAEQKNEISMLKSLIDNYRDAESKLFDKNQDLKQRIAELESKEKPTKINLNDRVKVKLTPLGAEIYYHQYDELNKQIKERGGKQLEPTMPRIDKDGYTEFQLWHFIELYGEHIGMCKKNVIDPLDIIISE